ncbi:hypothetical protein [Pandoraea pulmonicola]|uniref:Uncharacterized protein n=1 Tax=Pandoraea pulmonicola TaxID=93221 RepID=A0AAJ5D2Z8_PANPU|nr:hypothetical protein [Pandoraea pulmonicola]SUA93259.1 Uncharacterised protein [Pandoraea pulmonicola]
MEQITFKQCFKGAWRDGFDALRSRPILCLSIAVIVLVMFALGVSLKSLALEMAHDGTPAGPRIRLGLTSFAVMIVNVVAFTVLALHVYRYVILGPQAAREAHWYGRDLWRYLWTVIQIFVGMAVVWVVLVVLAVLAMRSTGRTTSFALLGTFFVLLFCGLIYVLVRVQLIYGQIAAGRSKRWRAAWRDSHGHFWAMFGTTLVSVLPLVVVGIVLTILFRLALVLMPDATLVVFGSLVLQTLLSVAWIAVAIGSAAWVYRRFANELLQLDDAPDDI